VACRGRRGARRPLAFVAFVVFGGFLTWRWPRVALVQLPVALYGVIIEIVGSNVRSRRSRSGCDARRAQPATTAGSSSTTSSVCCIRVSSRGASRYSWRASWSWPTPWPTADSGGAGSAQLTRCGRRRVREPYEGITSGRRSIPRGGGGTCPDDVPHVRQRSESQRAAHVCRA
jgi:hypothetical protein